MDALGFRYSVRCKTYYVDGHKMSENVEYRKKYILRYLKNERQCFRWIQLSMKEVEELANNDTVFNKEIGYEYKVNDVTFFEYHVDDNPLFQHRYRYLQFGGHLSVRKREDEKLLILLEQDESIFKQYTLTPKQ